MICVVLSLVMRFVLLVLFASSLYGSLSDKFIWKLKYLRKKDICRRMSAGSGEQSNCTAALEVIDLTQDCSTEDVGDDRGDRAVPQNR